MKFLKSETKSIIYIVVALLLGIFFGNFLGNTMLNNDAILVNADTYSDEVYILESGIYYDEINATIALNEFKDLGLNGLVVKEYNKYHVYLGVSENLNDFDVTLLVFAEKNIDYFIRIKKLRMLINDLDANSSEYKFYNQSMNYYISLLNDKQVILSQDYKDSITDDKMDIYNNILVLNNNLSSELAPLYKLYVYQSIIDRLNS